MKKYLIVLLICCIHLLPSYGESADEYMASGYSLLNQKKYNEALGDFEKAIELNHLFVEPWLGKGVCLYYLGHKDEAILCFDKGIELNPKSDMAWYTKGYVLYQTGNYHDAIICFNRTLEINPDDEYAKNYQLKAAKLLFKCNCNNCKK